MMLWLVAAVPVQRAGRGSVEKDVPTLKAVRFHGAEGYEENECHGYEEIDDHKVGSAGSYKELAGVLNEKNLDVIQMLL
jgi:hypothetical protein